MTTNSFHTLPFLLAVLLMVAGMSSCTKHYATAATAQKSAAAPVAMEKKAEDTPPVVTAQTDTISGPGLRDSLVGTWKLRLVEIDDAVNTLSSYGSQAERDQMLQKQKQFQEALKGLTSTFSADNTFNSIYGNQKDSGTWRVTRRRGIDTFSSTDGTPASYQVRAVTATMLVVLLDANDVKLVLTLDRQ